MASGVTNYGKQQILAGAFRDTALVVTAQFQGVLVDAGGTPNPDDEDFSEWVTRGFGEIAAGNGYTSGGIAIEDTAVGFDVNTADDTNDRGIIQIKDLVFTASGGPIPASGSGASYMLLTDDHATLNSRKVFAWFDLSGPLTVQDGGSITIKDAEIRGT